MSEGSGRGRWVVTLLVAAGATAGSTAPAWFRASGSSALAGQVAVAVSGGQAAPGVLAAAVVLLAAAAAVGLVGRVGRWVVVAVVVAAGVLVLVSVVGVLRDPAPVATIAVAAATGVTALAGPVSSTAWPWFAWPFIAAPPPPSLVKRFILNKDGDHAIWSRVFGFLVWSSDAA